MDNNSGDFNVNISAGDNKIKYYECNDNNCIFEILDDNQNDCKKNLSNQEAQMLGKSNNILNENLFNESKKREEDYGSIIVTSILDCGEQEQLQGVKINLYKINGLSPVLIESKITDTQGNVIFSQVPDGCYRVIELIDKRYFEKPKYIKWNEITIDDNNRKQNVIAVNRIKRFAAKSRCR